MLDSIQQFEKRWFLSEPALFSIFCFHQLFENRNMECAVRSGKGRIEYNPDLLAKHSLNDQEMIFRAELIRLLLQHPYARKPEGCSQRAISLASDFVITSYYPEMGSLFTRPEERGLPEKCYYEWYAGRIRDDESNKGTPMPYANSNFMGRQGETDEQSPLSKQGQEGNPSSMAIPGQHSCNNDCKRNAIGEGASTGRECKEQQSLKDRSELWEENPWMQEEVKNVVLNITDWGTLPGSMVEQIIANAKPKVDYRKVLSGFRSCTLSTKRKLTRMRPNRRTEFENMGSLYQLQTRYLCAVDVSGSISSEDLNNFFSIINRFFKYGVEKVDIITCDTEIHDVIEFKKAKSLLSVTGRGGTDFQPVINYMEEHPEYDGLIFFTDGYSETPLIGKIGMRQKILWFLNDLQAYNHNKDSLRKLGRVCYLNR